jgi:hypothetical protein
MFGAEAFAFVIRKAPLEIISSLWPHVLDSLRENACEDFSDGVGLLVFYTVQVFYTLKPRCFILNLEIFVASTKYPTFKVQTCFQSDNQRRAHLYLNLD